jgi:hypothetical protein
VGGRFGGRVFKTPIWARNWEATDIGKTGVGKWEKWDRIGFARRERVGLTDEAAELEQAVVVGRTGTAILLPAVGVRPWLPSSG